MASRGTLIKHVAHTHTCITVLLIFISLQHKQLVTCNERGRGEQASRLSASDLAAGAQTKANEAPQTQPNHPLVSSPPSENKDACEVFADYGKNYLTPVDVVVKNGDDNTACIKARFALSIKVEEAFTLTPRMGALGANNADAGQQPETIRSILGYLPLEQVLSVEDSCPSKRAKEKEEKLNETSKAAEGLNGSELKKEEVESEADDDELEMIVTFNCGKLAFTFKRDAARIYVSSIKGIVKLDKNLVREFVAVRPMFVTSDLDHHFKYDDIIEIPSEAQSKTYILTANFYFTEIEAFRKTTSRDFVQPPDEKSKPFSDEPLEVSKRAPSGDTQTPTVTQQPRPPSEVNS